MGNLDQAEKYLNAAWLLSQSPAVGNHLGQVYEKQHRKEAAVHIYRLALYRSSLRQQAIQSDQEKDKPSPARALKSWQRGRLSQHAGNFR